MEETVVTASVVITVAVKASANVGVAVAVETGIAGILVVVFI